MLADRVGIGRFNGSARVARPAMGTPVVLVHGILGQRHLYWNLLRGRLEAAGLHVEDAPLSYLLLGDMRVAARQLRQFVEEVLRRTGAERVDIVCHSAGGLVARYFLVYHGGARRTRRLVTLGTPHQGTYFTAGIPVVPIARQARPGSDFLHEIDRPLSDEVEAVNLWCARDGVVVPARNALWAEARNVQVPWTTHWGFLWRREVHARVVQELQAPAPRWTDADGADGPD